MTHPRRTAPQRHHGRGLSLIESLIAVAIVAVATGATLPGFRDALEVRRLEGAAAQLHTDLQLARSAAAAQNRTLRLSLVSEPGSACYVVHTGDAGSCTCGVAGVPICADGAQALRSQHFGPGLPTLQSNVGSMVLDGSKGTVSPTGTWRLQAADGRGIHLIVNIMGRVRKCSPAAAVAGYPAC
ncbi:hypothetical protein IP87_00155 [beta proteobacterium AAP121]|nr:hypothetical protein IP80_20675 [beta proteobacterium AAP65]KPG01143.1 hypothetical protein IP87_00155 [beta proteobacterium AAP121]